MDWIALQQHPAWDWLAAHQDWLGLLIIGIAFIESFALLGVVVPGVVLLYIAAFLAGSSGLAIAVALTSAWLGAVVGDGLSYLIGRYFHRHLGSAWPFKQHASWLARGERLFEQYGPLAIVAGRFIGPIRPIMPLVAGSLFMRKRVFFSINFASAVAWAPLYILPGYFAGAAIEGDSNWQQYIAGLVALVVILGFTAVALRRRFEV